MCQIADILPSKCEKLKLKYGRCPCAYCESKKAQHTEDMKKILPTGWEMFGEEALKMRGKQCVAVVTPVDSASDGRYYEICAWRAGDDTMTLRTVADDPVSAFAAADTHLA